MSDAHEGKIKQLKQTLTDRKAEELPVHLDVQRGDFASRFAAVRGEIARKSSANLLIIDQFGVKEVPDDIFTQLLGLETTDVLFFISSNTFRRFADVPEVARLFLPTYRRPTDYYPSGVLPSGPSGSRGRITCGTPHFRVFCVRGLAARRGITLRSCDARPRPLRTVH